MAIQSEHLWKKAKTRGTHNRYFAGSVKVVISLEEAPKVLVTHLPEILRRMGIYTKHMAEPLTV